MAATEIRGVELQWKQGRARSPAVPRTTPTTADLAALHGSCGGGLKPMAGQAERSEMIDVVEEDSTVPLWQMWCLTARTFKTG